MPPKLAGRAGSPLISPPQCSCAKEQARAIVEEYKPGQVDIYVDASVRKGRAGIGVYTTPSQVRILKTVASLD